MTSLNLTITFWKKLWNIPLTKGINVIQVLFDTPQYYFSKISFDLKKPSIVNHIKNTNDGLEKHNKEIKFISLDNLIFNLSSKKWQDDRMYHLCKQPFSLDAIPEISQFFASQISGMLGLSKKVLIFDKPVTSIDTLVLAKNSLKPDMRISLVRIIIAAITS